MRTLFPVLLALLLAGCVEYQPQPIDWETEVATTTLAPTPVTLSIADVRLRAIAYCPQLNALRLAHATSKAKADAAGYWEDPSLNFDGLRVLKEPKNFLTYGGSVSLTLPLTGIPGLERRAAEAYCEADRWEVIAAEYTTAAEAAAVAHTAALIQETIAALEQSRARPSYQEARRVSARLVAIGEMGPTELTQQKMAEKELDQTLFDLSRECQEAEAKVRRLTGLPPNCVFTWAVTNALPAASTNAVTLLDLTRAPQVRAALARYEGREVDLKKEIARQYPELSVGPAYTREDGYDKIGFTVGLSLPLWNRNRQGIAGADGAREEGRFAALVAWQEVVRQYAEAQQALALAGADVKVEACSEAQRLYAAGELSAGEYVNCLQQEWSQRVNALRRRLPAVSAAYTCSALLESLERK